MAKFNQHIVIVRSADKLLGSMSLNSSQAIKNTLLAHYSNVEVFSVADLSDLELLAKKEPDLVFLGVKFIASDADYPAEGENIIWLSDFLDGQNITYTGSDKDAYELEHNKPLAKSRVLKHGLTTSMFKVIEPNSEYDLGDMDISFPMFVKPTNSGGGKGIDDGSVVNTYHQLRKQVKKIHEFYRSSALIEKYLIGREFSVAILKKELKDGYFIMPIELIAPLDKNGARVLSRTIKSSNTEEDLFVEDENLNSLLSAAAIECFKALGARDFGRIDIRFDEHNVPHFLEANLIPSLTRNYGSFPKACLKNINLDYEEMILSIVNLALRRTLISPFNKV